MESRTLYLKVSHVFEDTERGTPMALIRSEDAATNLFLPISKEDAASLEVGTLLALRLDEVKR